MVLYHVPQKITEELKVTKKDSNRVEVESFEKVQADPNKKCEITLGCKCGWEDNYNCEYTKENE